MSAFTDLWNANGMDNQQIRKAWQDMVAPPGLPNPEVLRAMQIMEAWLEHDAGAPEAPKWWA